MIEFARPGFLLAGGVCSAIPLLLHLLSRRPSRPTALPTARFLSPEPFRSARFARPSDLLLLALRVALLALLGAAFAGPHWVRREHGTAELVLLDRSSAMADPATWRAAVSEARRRLLGPEGKVRGRLILFDTVAVPLAALSSGTLDSLRATAPRNRATSYATALAAVPAGAADLRGWDSVRVTLLTVPVWHGWRAGVTALRRAVWPGEIAIPSLPTPSAGGVAPHTGSTPPTAAVFAPPGQGRLVRAALAVLGFEVTTEVSRADLLVVLPGATISAGPLLERAQAGATVLVAGSGGRAGVVSLVWESQAGSGRGQSSVLYLGETAFSGIGGRLAGRPARTARATGWWGDGRPGAAVRTVGRGCVVFLAAELEAGTIARSAEYPGLLRALMAGCQTDSLPSTPLDAGARTVLRGSAPGAAVASAVLPYGQSGRPLDRFVFAAATVLALLETMLARRSISSRSAAPADG